MHIRKTDIHLILQGQFSLVQIYSCQGDSYWKSFHVKFLSEFCFWLDKKFIFFHSYSPSEHYCETPYKYKSASAFSKSKQFSIQLLSFRQIYVKYDLSVEGSKHLEPPFFFQVYM